MGRVIIKAPAGPLLFLTLQVWAPCLRLTPSWPVGSAHGVYNTNLDQPGPGTSRRVPDSLLGTGGQQENQGSHGSVLTELRGWGEEG